MKAHIFNIHDVVLIMTVVECLLLALFQAILPFQNRRYGRLLIAFFIAIAIGAATTLLLWNQSIATPPLVDRYLIPPLLLAANMLRGPILMLSVAAITQQAFCFHRRQLLHAIPAAVAVLLVYMLGISSDDLRMGAPDSEPYRPGLLTFIWDAAKLVPLIYTCWAVWMVQRYRARLKDEYSHFSTVEANWLNFLTLGFLGNWAWTVIVHIVAKYSSPETADTLGIVDNYVTFILINALFTYSLVYAHNVLATHAEPVRDKAPAKPSDEAVERVRKAMDVDKIYLKQNVNIEQFADGVAMSVKEVSAVINKHFGTNFFEFINSYRVEEAKRLLASEEHRNMNVLDVLMEAGFNSKSAFHRSFKRLVDESPTEYRKRMLTK